MAEDTADVRLALALSELSKHLRPMVVRGTYVGSIWKRDEELAWMLMNFRSPSLVLH